MTRLAGWLFGLRDAERRVAVRLAGYHFVILFCLYLLKPVRDGLFLTERGTGELPLVFVIVAIATIPASLLQRRLGRHYRRHRLTNRLTALHVVVLAASGGLVVAGVPGAAYVTYVWVALFGVMATSQFWVLASGFLDSAQSRRTFAVLNLGGILGAVVGGEVTSQILQAGWTSPVALLFLAAGLFGATGPLVARLHRLDAAPDTVPDGAARAATPAPTDDRADDRPDSHWGGHVGRRGVSAIRRFRERLEAYPLIGWIAALVGVVSVASTLLDFQLKAIATETFASEAELTAFMGRFYGRISLVALVIQTLLATRLKRYVRTTSALFVLPVAIALGSTALWLAPGLIAAAGLRGADQSLKHSVDKTARELLYLPLPQSVKRQIKVPVDLVVDQTAHGIAGGVLFGLVTGLGWRPAALVPVTLGVVAIWLGVALRAHRGYLRQFRDALHEALERRMAASDARGTADGAVDDAPALTPAEREAAMRHLGRYVAFGQALALHPDTDVRPDTNPDPNADPNPDPNPDMQPDPQLDADPQPDPQPHTQPDTQPDTQRWPTPSEGGVFDASPDALRAARRDALRELFRVLHRAHDTPGGSGPGRRGPGGGGGAASDRADDLLLALDALEHDAQSVRSDAVTFLDGILPGDVRDVLVPLLDDPTGEQALRHGPPLLLALRDPTPGTRERVTP